MKSNGVPGSLYIVSAPSGAGKTSLVEAWLGRCDNLKVSVSYTTRTQRSGETNGVNYHFVNLKDFEKMIAEESFFEYAKVFNHYYGTAKTDILGQLEQGQDIVLEIDWQGAQQVRELYPDAVSIFILPPSYQVLRERLTKRGRDQSEEIEERINQAREEVSHCDEADFIIINDNFDEALEELVCISRTFELKVSKQKINNKLLLDSLLDS